ncbi:MAG: septum formation initiator family protein [Kiritimatiellae bacterium]|nr:septum formation initiator family protein [Kiritimatiellia bacterium]
MNVLLKIITRTTLVTAFLCVIVAGLVIIPPKLAQLRRLEQQRNEMLRRIDHKNNEIKVLKDKQQRFKAEPEFVEHIARENKRVRPGELVFVFDSEDAK